MDSLDYIPRYRDKDIYTYIAQLRKFVFFSQQDAADYFRLHRTRISRYENPFENDEAPAEYLACLGKLIVEHEKGAVELQQVLLADANAAFLDRHQHKPFSDWAMLCQKASDYLEQQHKEYAGKQITQNFSKKLSKSEQIEVLENRIGPASYHELIGMEQEIHHLIDLLTRQGPPWIVAISGLGGIGKTSLAHAVVRKVIREQLFDNVAWLRLRQRSREFERWRLSAEQAVFTPETLFDQLLLQLAPDVHQSAGASNLNSLNLLRVRLRQIPHLVVIDNLETIEELDKLIAKLRSLTDRTKFLLTSRTNLHEEPVIYPFPLTGLNKTDGITLLQREAAHRNTVRIRAVSDTLLESIYEVVGGIPLALRLVVGQAYNRSVDTILSELGEAKGKKNEAFFEFIYQEAWQHLSQPAKRVLLSMLLATEPGASLEYLVALTGFKLEMTRLTVEELVALNLSNSNNATTERELRYTTHNLTRAYLRHVLNSTTSTDYSVWLRASIANSLRYMQRIIQGRDGILSPEEQEQALHTLWYGLKDLRLWDTTRFFLLEIAPKMEQAGLREVWVPYLAKAVRLSRQLRDRSSEAELRFHLGTLRQRRGDYLFAHQEFGLSAELFTQLDQPYNQVKAINRKAYVARLQRNFAPAEELANQALGISQEGSSERAYSYLVLGTVELDQRRFVAAERLFQQALNIWQIEDNHRMMAWCLTNLGAVLRPLHRYEEAIEIYKREIQFFEEAEDPVHLAVAWMNLGNVYLTQDEARQALEWYEKANNIFEQVQEQLRLAQIHMNMGMAHYQLEEWGSAKDFFLRCVKEYETVGNLERVANGLDGLGLTLTRQGRYQEAIETFQDALRRLEPVKQNSGYDRLLAEINEHLTAALEKESFRR